MPWVSGGRPVSERVVGGGDQGVPEPGAVVAGVEVLLPGPRVGRLGRGSGRGLDSGQVERQQRGHQQGAVLGRPAALQADAAGAVLADREVAVQVGGAFLTFQLGLEAAVDGVGVDDLDQVPPGSGELGGVEVSGLADQDLLAAAADQVTGRQVVDGLGR